MFAPNCFPPVDAMLTCLHTWPHLHRYDRTHRGHYLTASNISSIVKSLPTLRPLRNEVESVVSISDTMRGALKLIRMPKDNAGKDDDVIIMYQSALQVKLLQVGRCALNCGRHAPSRGVGAGWGSGESTCAPEMEGER